MTATCRVYLSTYRRNKLLPRALESLLKQTLGDWVCELHNDDPGDAFPARLAASIGDPRITVVNHDRNYGAVATFNLLFKRIAEPFFTLLEDDNWWDPDFLETMVSTLNAYPQVQIAWANMRVWKEHDDGSWRDTGRTVSEPGDGGPKLFWWPDPRRFPGALHSNGAMLARGDFDYPPVPPDIDFAAIEPFRERTFRYPLLLVQRPLANYSVTLSSTRRGSQAGWTHAVTLLSGSYLSTVPLSEEALVSFWDRARTGARSTHTLFFAAMHFPQSRHVIRFARANDWLWSIAYCLRHPRIAFEVLRLLRTRKAQEQFLLRHTRERQREAERLAAGAGS